MQAANMKRAIHMIGTHAQRQKLRQPAEPSRPATGTGPCQEERYSVLKWTAAKRIGTDERTASPSAT
jgi:hypothetical protein